MIIKPKFLLQLLQFAPECTPMILLEGENSPLERDWKINLSDICFRTNLVTWRVMKKRAKFKSIWKQLRYIVRLYFIIIYYFKFNIIKSRIIDKSYRSSWILFHKKRYENVWLVENIEVLLKASELIISLKCIFFNTCQNICN